MLRLIFLGVTPVFASCSAMSNLQPNPAPVVLGQPSEFPHITQAPKPTSVAAVTAAVGPLPEIDHTYRGSVPMLDHSIPLPAGEWIVIERDRKTYRAGPPTGSVMLMRHDGAALTGLIEIQGNRQPRAGVTNPVNPFCTMTEAIWHDVQAAVPGGQQDCAMVTVARTATWQNDSAPAALHAAAKSFVTYGVTPPPVLVVAGFYVANSSHSLSEVVWLNPDQSGIAQDPSTQPSQSGWAAANLGRDPSKEAYIDRVKTWSMGWRTVMKAVIDGTASAPSAESAAMP